MEEVVQEWLKSKSNICYSDEIKEYVSLWTKHNEKQSCCIEK
jgi:hypothetical protein